MSFELSEFNTYDWNKVFAFSDFDLSKVIKILYASEGWNDGDCWMIAGVLTDGRYFYIEAGCDYTGWDCQCSGSCSMSNTLDNLIRYEMTDNARYRFGINLHTM
jgi:hypothetical protein